MESVTRIQTDRGMRWSWELLVEPEVRKVLTLDQVFAVFRQTVQPESLTAEDREDTAEDTLGVFQNGGGLRYFHSRTGTFNREGRTVQFGLDDDVVNNEDGSLTAAFFWWESAADERVEGWFRELVQALEEAQENLLLFGRAAPGGVPPLAFGLRACRGGWSVTE